MRRLFAFAAVLLLPAAVSAQSTDLAFHDFVYSGESHQRRLFVIKGGKVAWSFEEPDGKGEISDAVMLSNGNILFAHQFAVEEVSPEKKILWHYDVPAGHEVHTAVPIGMDRVLYVQNGNPALVRVVNIRTNAVEKEWTLAVGNPQSTHPQVRHARLTAQGTLLVAHMDWNRAAEYDVDGHELWSFPASNPWSAEPLPSENVLITDKIGVREVTRHGDTVWSWRPEEAGQYRLHQYADCVASGERRHRDQQLEQ